MELFVSICSLRCALIFVNLRFSFPMSHEHQNPISSVTKLRDARLVDFILSRHFEDINACRQSAT